MRTTLQNFSPLTPAVQKLSPKVFIFDFFQDPCSSVDSFPDHLAPFKTIVQANIGSIVYVVCLKGKLLVQSSFQDPHTSTITHFSGYTDAKCKIWFISRPLFLVTLQHNGRTASISAPQV